MLLQRTSTSSHHSYKTLRSVLRPVDSRDVLVALGRLRELVAGDAALGKLRQGIALGNQSNGSATLGDVADVESRVLVEGVVGEAHDGPLRAVVGHDPRARDEGALRLGGQVKVRLGKGQERHTDGARADVDIDVVLARVGRVVLIFSLDVDAPGEWRAPTVG